MAGRYIPPALRKHAEQGRTALHSSSSSPQRYTAAEIYKYFWPAEAAEHDSCNAASKTLHDSAKTRGQLAYMLLFDGANPRWESERIIFAKSSLDLLPTAAAKSAKLSLSDAANIENGHRKIRAGQADTVAETESCGASDENNHLRPVPVSDRLTREPAEADSRTNSTLEASDKSGERTPIAVFKQIDEQGGTVTSFVFEGWFYIEKADFLEPHSAELIRMLEQKWSFTERDGSVVKRERDEAAWEISLNRRWAVVKFANHMEESGAKEPPAIKKLTGSSEEGTSVNAMLAALRVAADQATANRESAKEGQGKEETSAARED